MKMEIKVKQLTRIIKKTDYGIGGMRMDRNGVKELTRMVKKMDYSLNGMKMDRRKKKELSRTGN